MRSSAVEQEVFLTCAHNTLVYALQPIVNIHTGSIYGYEALLRGVAELGFKDVFALLNYAWKGNFSGTLDTLLRNLAIARFAQLPNAGRYRLFFNLDSRLLEQEHPDKTIKLLQHHGLTPDNLCLELSEKIDLTASTNLSEVIASYRRHRFQLAIDDFGSGYAGLRLLYEHPPDLLKIDRFFISGIANDHKKRLFVAHMVQLAHVMGIHVIAEGIETEKEFLACKEAGCDLAQGYLIAHPELDLALLPDSYTEVIEMNRRDRRVSYGDLELIKERLEYLPPLSASASVKAMFEAFRLAKIHQVIPVLDHCERPLGLIHEVDIKDYIYSIYGRELIMNPAFSRSLQDFARPCPAVDIHLSTERLLEAFSADINPAGLIVTQDARYLGFISATSLLQLLEQKNLAAARDQNPLTKLPGNIPIHEYVSHILSERDCTWHLAYFDFDNFKAFNDHYGFRLGDRAILMFAELLQKHLSPRTWFIGHIGGDDFFAGIKDAPRQQAIEQMQHLLAKFRVDIQSLYDPQDRQRGHLRARDRFGEERDMPLMRCSAALIEIRPGENFGTVDTLSRIIAAMKHQAKASSSGLVFRHDSDPHGCALILTETPLLDVDTLDAAAS